MEEDEEEEEEEAKGEEEKEKEEEEVKWRLSRAAAPLWYQFDSNRRNWRLYFDANGQRWPTHDDETNEATFLGSN